MDRGRAGNEDRPVEPGEARASGNDPDAVEVRREGGAATTRNAPGRGASGPTSPLRDPRATKNAGWRTIRRRASGVADRGIPEGASPILASPKA